MAAISAFRAEKCAPWIPSPAKPDESRHQAHAMHLMTGLQWQKPRDQIAARVVYSCMIESA